MDNWLFSASGDPVAFTNGDSVFLRSGRFLGKLIGQEVWKGSYQGEVVGVDRLVYRIAHNSAHRVIPGTPETPVFTGLPGNQGPITLPSEFREIDEDQ
jgi:hypothetical protein